MDMKNDSAEKKLLLNNPRIIEYLFNKSIKNPPPAIISYSDKPRKVRLEINDQEFYETQINILAEHCQVQSANPYKIQIKTILDKIKINLVYLSEWDFVSNNKNNVIKNTKPVIYEQDWTYDFFGIIEYRSKLSLFVILFDEENISRRIEVRKQYILYQMNIHLLRLNSRSDIKTEINNFIKKIIYKDSYVIIHGIRGELKINDQIMIFVDNYIINHHIYLKMRPKKNTSYKSEDDEYFENDWDINLFVIDPPDPGIVVSPRVWNYLMEKEKQKVRVKNKNENRAGEILVEFIKKGEKLPETNAQVATSVLKKILAEKKNR